MKLMKLQVNETHEAASQRNSMTKLVRPHKSHNSSGLNDQTYEAPSQYSHPHHLSP